MDRCIIVHVKYGLRKQLSKYCEDVLQKYHYSTKSYCMGQTHYYVLNLTRFSKQDSVPALEIDCSRRAPHISTKMKTTWILLLLRNSQIRVN